MERSRVGNRRNKPGERGRVSKVRTSFGTFLRRGQDEVVRDIEKRIADFTSIPVECGESLQVLHYEVGQKFLPHYDFIHPNNKPKDGGGQRIATFLIYLSDVEEGGETIFPRAKPLEKGPPEQKTSKFCKFWNSTTKLLKFCDPEKGLAVKPSMGTALLFWDTLPNGKEDRLSLHGGCAVIKGDKWSCTKWLHASEYKNA